jgi:hypothetical protein
VQKVLRRRAKFPRCWRTDEHRAQMISRRGRGLLQVKRLVLRLPALAAGRRFRKFPAGAGSLFNLYNLRQVLRACPLLMLALFLLFHCQSPNGCVCAYRFLG